jgi:hypothetical protein
LTEHLKAVLEGMLNDLIVFYLGVYRQALTYRLRPTIPKMKREEKGWRELTEKRPGEDGFIPARGLLQFQIRQQSFENDYGGN